MSQEHMYECVLYCHHIYYKELDSNLNINVSYSNELLTHATYLGISGTVAVIV